MMTGKVTVHPDDVQITFVRSQGAGGQNVNKVASAVQLRFDIAASRLPAAVRQRLLSTADRRLTRDGILIIKAQRYRTQDANREDAMARLQALVDAAAVAPVKRVATRPTLASKRRRLEGKQARSKLKSSRSRPDSFD